MKKILVIGSTTVDVTIRVDHVPVAEEDIQPVSQSMAVGGCAHNVAHMLLHHGIPHVLFSPVGTGIYGEMVEQAFRKEGRPVLLKTQEENGVCYCLVDADGDRTFLALHGAEYRFKEEWLKECALEEQDLIYVCGLEIEETTGDLLLQHLKRAKKGAILFAPGARIGCLQEDRLQKIMELSPMLHMNAKEARILLHRLGMDAEEDAELSAVASQLYAQTKAGVILTDGAHGSVYCEESGCVFLPAEEITQVDGNGAGDAHCGAVLAGLAKEKGKEDILYLANRAGALVASHAGAIVTQEEFDEWMNNGGIR